VSKEYRFGVADTVVGVDESVIVVLAKDKTIGAFVIVVGF